MSAVQGLCLIALIFATTMQLNNVKAQPKLIRMICLLYCNQQIRRFFTNNADTVITLFPNVMLAIGVATLLISTVDQSDSSSVEDLRFMLEGLLYMYGDILDFTFQYGALPITTASLGVSLVLKNLTPSDDPMQTFIRRLLSIVSTNILYQGTTTMINSTIQAKLIETIAATSILRLILPSMESYLTYLTAIQLTMLVPGLAVIFLCMIVWTDLIPVSGRGWVGEVLSMYVIQAVINYLIFIPTWGAVVVLIVMYYVDFAIANLR